MIKTRIKLGSLEYVGQDLNPDLSIQDPDYSLVNASVDNGDRDDGDDITI
jgi:hypothetical protein